LRGEKCIFAPRRAEPKQDREPIRRMGTSVRMDGGSLADPEGYFSYESIAIHWRGSTSG